MRFAASLAFLFLTPHIGAADTPSPLRTVTTIAGTGRPGFSGDNGPASAAQLNQPFGLSRGPGGDLYFCDTANHRIRKITRDGLIHTITGTGDAGYAGDNGPALEARLNEPYELRFDRAGNLFFVEMRNNIVRRVDAKTGTVSTVAGTGRPGFSGDNGPATQAMLNQPHSIQFDPSGDLYICDIANHRIRKVSMKTGILTTFAGTGERKPTPDNSPLAGTPLNGPRAIDFDKDGNLWLALRDGNAIYQIDMTQKIFHHIAGCGKTGFTGNGGPALAAALSGPKGIAVGPDGNIYFTDTESHTVRMINRATGKIELIAGTGQKGDGPDGDASTCSLARPHGIFVDADGAIYIGDTDNHRIRVVRRHR
jgi:streptogramin lyase